MQTLSPSSTEAGKSERRRHIPILSSSVTRLVCIRPNDEQYFESVMSIVMDDPGLTSEAFRLSTSAVFGGRIEPATLSDVLLRLGARRFVSLMIGSHVVSVFVPASNELSALLRHSIFVASGNRYLAATFPSIGVHPEWAYVNGMLHNIGTFALALTNVDAYLDLLGEFPLDSQQFLDAEQATFGTNHVDVGAELAGEYGLPEDTAAVIRWHHTEQIPVDVEHAELIRLTQLSLAFDDQVEEGRISGVEIPDTFRRTQEALKKMDLDVDSPKAETIATAMRDEVLRHCDMLGTPEV